MSSQTLQFDEPSREDIAAILAMTQRTRVFDPQEVATVEELLNDFFTQGAEASGYWFITCRDGNGVVGFACYGPRPLTQGTFDLYWIATDPRCQGQGVGARLLERACRGVRALGGYLLVVETSGRADYLPARSFYESHHFELAAHIRDFYAPGDDLMMYVLRLDENQEK